MSHCGGGVKSFSHERTKCRVGMTSLEYGGSLPLARPVSLGGTWCLNLDFSSFEASIPLEAWSMLPPRVRQTTACGISELRLARAKVPYTSTCRIRICTSSAKNRKFLQLTHPQPMPVTGDLLGHKAAPHSRGSVPDLHLSGTGGGAIGRTGTSWTTEFPSLVSLSSATVFSKPHGPNIRTTP
jgi:hypothetical protein